MANQFQPLNSYRTIRVFGPTTVADVEFVTVSTLPTGIVFSIAIALEVWQANGAVDQLNMISELLEGLVTNGNVTGGSPSQDVDSSGLLVDYVDLTVTYDQTTAGLPPLEGTVSMKINEVSLWATDPSIADQTGLPTPAQQVGEEYDRLKALAGG